jgi:hypothetical protein
MLALLAEIDHPDSIVRVWTGIGTLRYDGQDWTGLGVLGRVRGASESSSLSIKQVTFELSGVPPESTQFLSARVRNREAQVWLAVVDHGKVYIEPHLVIWAKMDYQRLKVDDSGLARIEIIANVGFWNIERATNRTWTHEEQQSDYPGDVGLSLLPELTDKESNWRQS